MNSGFWKFSQWKDVPIYFHWSVLLWLPWYLIQNSSKNLFWIIPTFFSFATILLVHELGHAIAAKYTGAKVYAIKLFVIHGECELETPYYERDYILIAWAGVIAQLCLFVVAVVFNYLLSRFLPILVFQLAPVFNVVIGINFMLMITNLIPVKPLDGYIAWRIIPFTYRKIRSYKFNTLLKFRNPFISRKKSKINAEDADKIAKDLFDRFKK
ncbi:metalloprotease [Undibacterium sp. Ji50W]|uniref:metalloprotease n=1 Tax=Undibacterium sp. Ji50W TaxID=3413041 RepID=UPI003BEFD263